MNELPRLWYVRFVRFSVFAVVLSALCGGLGCSGEKPPTASVGPTKFEAKRMPK